MRAVTGKMLLIVLLCFVQQAFAAYTVVLYPVVRVPEAAASASASSIRLTQIARIVGSREDSRRLKDLRVLVSSLKGKSRVEGTVVIRVLQAIPELSEAEVLGPTWITVASPQDQNKSLHILEQAEAALLQTIDERWPDRYRNLELSYIGDAARLPVGSNSDFSFDLAGLDRLGRRNPL